MRVCVHLHVIEPCPDQTTLCSQTEVLVSWSSSEIAPGAPGHTHAVSHANSNSRQQYMPQTQDSIPLGMVSQAAAVAAGAGGTSGRNTEEPSHWNVACIASDGTAHYTENAISGEGDSRWRVFFFVFFAESCFSPKRFSENLKVDFMVQVAFWGHPTLSSVHTTLFWKEHLWRMF